MQRAKGQESTKVDKYLLCQNICAYFQESGKAVENGENLGGKGGGLKHFHASLVLAIFVV